MNLQRGPKNENNIGAAWIVFRIVGSLYSPGPWDYHLGRSEEEMKLKYIVTIDLDKFEFENGAEALKFAELAAANFKPGTYHDKIDVYMNLKVDPEAVEVEEDSDESNY